MCEEGPLWGALPKGGIGPGATRTWLTARLTHASTGLCSPRTEPTVVAFAVGTEAAVVT